MEKFHFQIMKNFLVIVCGALVIGACAVTSYNTYRLFTLKTEINHLKRNLTHLQKQQNYLREEEDYTTAHSLMKRDVVGTTRDGVPVNSETYVQHKNRNNSQHAYYKLAATPIPIHAAPYFASTHNVPQPAYRSSRVMHQDDKTKAFRQIVRKPDLKSADPISSSEYVGSSEGGLTIIRDDGISRKRYPKGGRVKPLPAIHFHGDTSKYIVGRDEHYNGNGHIRHLQRSFKDWRISDWAERMGMTNHFDFQEGVVTIKESGLYFVYAQIYYLDEHDRNGYAIEKDSKKIFVCTVAAHSSRRMNKGNTCYTGGVIYLEEDERINLVDLSDDRSSIFEPGKSFFGVIKLGDGRGF